MNTKIITHALSAALLFTTFASSAQPSSPAPQNAAQKNGESFLLSVSGAVDVAPAGTTAWNSGKKDQSLKVGDRIRTGKNSRAVVRLSNLSILRVYELTTLEIQPPAKTADNPTLDLKSGTVYFFNRDKPASTQFRTPSASGAIRGTEFNLAVAEDGRMLLTLVDGEVNVQNELGSLELKTGEQAMVEPGQAPQKTPSVDAINIIQWTLYYPGVVDVDELGLGDDLKVQMAPSLDAYRAGDLLKAIDSYPWDRESASPEDKVYRAALSLAAGKVDQTQNLLQNLGEGRAPQIGEALKMLVAAVKNQKADHSHQHSLATEYMASSYYHQSQGDLAEALADAKAAATKSPNFGFAHARVAELEFSFANNQAAMSALDKSLSLSPRNAQALALKGFLLASQNKIGEAQKSFEQAVEMDGNLGNAWLGRGLCKIKKGHIEDGRKDLETAAGLEPNRAILRAYLGKAWSMGRAGMYAWDQTLATKELNLAKTLDPNDPTSWLYAALLHQQRNQVNDAVQNLEHSQNLNDNRRIFRSKLLLDQDRAVRSANLASVYRDAGMTDYSVREASRAVDSDPLNFSAHLFLSDSYAALLDPRSVTVRYETAWLSELLVANLLQPVGAGNLSQNVSQQEYSKLFEADKMGISSTTEYWSTGEWRERASQYGNIGNSSYALDYEYLSIDANRPNSETHKSYYSAKFKQQLTPNDSVLLQVEAQYTKAGDTLQSYENTGLTTTRSRDDQEPNIYVGYNHQWSPGQHTLFQFVRLDDELEYTNRYFAFGANLSDALRSETVLYSGEIQHIAQLGRQTLIFGGRFQDATTENSIYRRIGFGNIYTDRIETDFQRYNFYFYDRWQICDPLQLTAGLTYDHMDYPANTDIAPITPDQEKSDQVSPKVGLRYTPWENTTFRGAYTRSMGGLNQDNSLRLEPSQIAGFTQTYRSIIPESIIGTVAGTEFTTYGLGVEQTFKTKTYVTLDAEILESKATRQNGFFDQAPLPPEVTPNPRADGIPFAGYNFNQRIKFREQSVNFSLTQLLGEEWAVGLRYRISKADFKNSFPPNQGPTAVNQDVEAILNQATLFAIYNHRCGFFARPEVVFAAQSNDGYTDDPGTADVREDLPGDEFVQFNLFAGYRFPRRQAEIQLGLLNIGDQNYKLNPLNFYIDYPRERTLTVSFKFNY